ncbi:MAG: hypothetical protein AB8E82_03385 [Aureispira sp.]
MRKIAVFVEGQTELIFTRELILKCYEWQNVQLECYSLFNDADLNTEDYPFSNPNASIYYQLLNIGNDKKVLSSILKREKYLFSNNQAFDKIIGLRDMYSKEYRELTTNHTISPELNQRFIDSHKTTIEARAAQPNKIAFQFSIMELEAWFLGMDELIFRVEDTLTNEALIHKLEMDLVAIDPENTIFNPAKRLNAILELAGSGYNKKKDEVNTWMGHIAKEDFCVLYRHYHD